MFKKKQRKGTKRKEVTKADDSSDDETEVVTTKRGIRGVSSTSKSKVKLDTTELLRTTYESTRSAMPEGPQDMGATATVEIDTERDKDAQAVFERIQKQMEEGGDEDGTYKGLAGQGQVLQRKETTQGNAYKGFSAKGPLRAPLNIRTTVRWDYQPDICKDYKETGYCGYGDSCKFLHDRTDYKAGWQIDRDYERQQKEKEDLKQYEIESSDDDDDDLPFACFICRKPFDRPVVTKCKHYFCEPCALNHFKKSMKCYVCSQNTGGVFNPAKELMAKIKEKAAQEAADANGSENNGDDEKKGSDDDESDD